jgi:hypothetical protein
VSDNTIMTETGPRRVEVQHNGYLLFYMLGCSEPCAGAPSVDGLVYDLAPDQLAKLRAIVAGGPAHVVPADRLPTDAQLARVHAYLAAITAVYYVPTEPGHV